MQYFEVYERDISGNIQIGDSTQLWQACAAAWSRARRNKSVTYVWDADSNEIVDEYDCTYMALNERTDVIQDFEIDA